MSDLPVTAPDTALTARQAHSGRDWLAQLNPQQRAAALYDAPAPLLIIAGAGSGKTNTLAHRVAHLLARGEDPRAILLLTFSRRAAHEMVRRVERLVTTLPAARSLQAAAALIWAGTFHAIGARLLREFAHRIGIDAAFTIHDREDSADLMNLVRQDAGLSLTERRFPQKGTCLAIYSRVVNCEERLDRVLETQFPWCAGWESQLRALFDAYVAAKQKHNVLDYDDLLLYWSGMLRDASIAAELGARFRHVLVDEYQDTNRLQASVLRALKPDGHGLTAVGDDAQAIYSFRGATVRNILEFPGQFAAPASVITLERNYRSGQPLLDAANAVIAQASERFTKRLCSDRSGVPPRLLTVADEAEQARYVVERVLEQRESGLALRHQAVLFRAAQHSLQVELELGRRNVPFVKFGGLKFLESAHVKDLLACLRWAENPRDRVTGFRVLLLLPGVGPKIAAHALDAMQGAQDPFEALHRFAGTLPGGAEWNEFLELCARLRSASWPSDLGLVRRWYEPLLFQRYENAPIRAADLQALENIATTYASRERFLTDLTLDPPGASSDEAGDPSRDEEYLTLSTVHSAKGQEWNAVYLLNAVDGCIPSDLATGAPEEIDEERRLLYVAMTRAKDHLEILVPQRFYVHQQSADGDRHVYAVRTRFIPAEIEHLFDLRSWPPAAYESRSASTNATSSRIDLAAQMRAMWRT